MPGPITEIAPEVKSPESLAGLKTGSTNTSDKLSEKLIAAKASWFIGRTISFALNDQSIEMAVTRTIAGRVRLIDAQKQYLPSFEKPEDRWTFYASAIEEYLKEHHNRFSRICLALTGQETCFRTFLMPAMKSNQLATAAVFEIRKQLPYPVEDCNYSFRVSSIIDRGDKKEIKISLSAATKRLITEVLPSVEAGGHEVAVVYNAPEAVGELLRHLPDFDPDTNYALINVERDRTQLAYYRGSNLIFYHYASLGSSAIGHRTDVQRFDDFAQLLAGEVQNSLDYYGGQASSNVTQKVFVHGDLAYSDELISRLTDHFGFEFCRFPAEKLDIVSDNQTLELVSLGATLCAIGAASCHRRIANLLPSDKIQKRREGTNQRLTLTAIVIISMILMIGWMGQLGAIKTSEKQLIDLQETIAKFQTSEIASKLNRIKSDLATEQAYHAKTTEENKFIGLAFKQLAVITPATIKLILLEADALDTAGTGWRLVGVVRANGSPPEIILAEYIHQLEESQYYQEVILDRYRKKIVDDGFELEFEIRARGIV